MEKEYPIGPKESEKKEYPTTTEQYVLYEEIGKGFTASVHRALCLKFNEIVAIKIFNYEHHNYGLHDLYREQETMALVDHPNVLKSHCSFLGEFGGKEKALWVVMPFMERGSCLHILKAAHLDGFEEGHIAAVLMEVLKGLQYLHHHGYVHRDVKAGNILIDSHGDVKLGDFGMMAPEVMDQDGYSFKSMRADIWSFGITALELAHGHAPFSTLPPSKPFKQMIACCLNKDPTKRPSANKLLDHSFFKQTSSSHYNSQVLLEELAALGHFMKKEEDMLAQFKMTDQQQQMVELSRKAEKARQSLLRQGVLPRRITQLLFQNCFDVRQKAHPAFSCPIMKKGSLKSMAERILRRDLSPPAMEANTFHRRRIKFSLCKVNKVSLWKMKKSRL